MSSLYQEMRSKEEMTDVTVSSASFVLNGKDTSVTTRSVFDHDQPADLLSFMNP